jgi:hypothetical protein
MSNCILPNIAIPNPSDLIGALISLLQTLGFPIPQMRTIQVPGLALFCPLD